MKYLSLFLFNPEYELHMIPKPVFWFILILILLLPFTRNWKLLVFGDYTKGKVKEVKTTVDIMDKTFGGETSFSVIIYSVNGKEYKVDGPIDLKLSEGKILNIAYNKENPKEYLIINLRTIYLSKLVILPFVLLVIWISFYLSIRESNKPRYL